MQSRSTWFGVVIKVLMSKRVNQAIVTERANTASKALSIIIPTNNLNPNFYRCLKSLEEAALLDNFELIVVLDGIKNELSFFSQFNIPNLNTVVLSKNKGPAFARNEGAKSANGDILFFIDADVILLPASISRVHMHFAKSDAKEALIGSYDNDPEEKSVVSKYRNLLHHYTHQKASVNATTFWGACGAIKKEVFWSVNGFDESFERPSVEDIALGYRLISKGYSIRLDKELQVKHLKKWSLWNTIKTDVFYRASPWTKLLHESKKLGINDLNINYEERLSVVLLSLGLCCVGLMPLFGEMISPVLILFGSLLFVKRNIYLFFARHFKIHQLPVVIILHWVYLLSALMGFILGTIDYYRSKKTFAKAIYSTTNDKQELIKGGHMNVDG